MLNTSAAYKAAIIASTRRIMPQAVLDISSPDIVIGTVSSSGTVWYVDPAQISNKEMTITARYVSLERNYWRLDKTFLAPPTGITTVEAGYLIKVLSDESGSFTGTKPFIRMPLANVSILQAVSVVFSEVPSDGIGVDFTLDVYSGSTLVSTVETVGNTAQTAIITGFLAYEVTAIRVTFNKWSKPQRYPRIAELVPGIYERMTGGDIMLVDVQHSTAFDNMTVSHSSAILTVGNKDKRYNPYTKNSIFKSIETRQEIPISFAINLPDDTTEVVPVGVFYQTDGGWETSANGLTVTFKLVDLLGLVKDRTFETSSPPTTVEGWVTAILGLLGEKFATRYTIPDSIRDLEITADAEAVNSKRCGDLLRWLAMRIGAYVKTDPETGYLELALLSNDTAAHISQGNMPKPPETHANSEVADITFRINGKDSPIAGTLTASGQSLNIENPFITTIEQALVASRNILAHFGGNKYKIIGRGDMSSELGDVDTIETGFDAIVAGRRFKQQLRIQNGMMKNVTAEFIQSTGSGLHQSRALFETSGTWTAPSGVTAARIILVGKGQDGSRGTGATYDWPGTPGLGGPGGKVYVQDIVFNAGSSFSITVADEVTMGSYSSANGESYPNGYGDINSGSVYGVPGVDGEVRDTPTPGANAPDGYGYGGGGGSAGQIGLREWEDSEHIFYTVIRVPGSGAAGGTGGSGCAIIYYDA